MDWHSVKTVILYVGQIQSHNFKNSNIVKIIYMRSLWLKACFVKTSIVQLIQLKQLLSRIYILALSSHIYICVCRHPQFGDMQVAILT